MRTSESLSSAIAVNIKYSIFIVTVNISHFQNVAKHLANYSMFSKDLYLVVMKTVNFVIGSNISFDIDIFKSIPFDIDDLFSLTCWVTLGMELSTDCTKHSFGVT